MNHNKAYPSSTFAPEGRRRRRLLGAPFALAVVGGAALLALVPGGCADGPAGAERGEGPTGEASSAVCFDVAGTMTCDGHSLWPGGLIHYSWHPEVTAGERTAFRAAMDRWTAATSGVIVFQESPSTTPRLIIRHNGGLAPVGRPSANAETFMTADNADHELGHAIGFKHAFQREDRNRYLAFDTTLDLPSGYANAKLCTHPDSNHVEDDPNGPNNWYRCAPDNPSKPQAIGPYSYRSTMMYWSEEIHHAQSGATTMALINAHSGSATALDGADAHVKPEDGSAALELYQTLDGWGVFRPLDRAGSSGFRDYRLTTGGVTLVGSPGIESWGNGFVDVYARGSNGHLYQKNRTGAAAYSDWLDLGGSIASDPAAVSWGSGRSDVVAVSTGGGVSLTTFASGAWRTPVSLGQPSAGIATGSAPSIASWGPGRLDVFVRGADDKLYVSTCASGTCLVASSFSAWANVPGGVLLGNPSAIERAPDTIDVFVHGYDHQLWTAHYTTGGGWSSWSTVPGGTLYSNGSFASSPSATTAPSTPLDVYLVGTDRRVWRTFWNGTSWSGFGAMGGLVAANGSVAAVTTTAGGVTQVRIAAPVDGVDSGATAPEGRGVWLRTYPQSAF